jgi:hypothetical protein
MIDSESIDLEIELENAKDALKTYQVKGKFPKTKICCHFDLLPVAQQRFIKKGSGKQDRVECGKQRADCAAK